MKRNRLKSFSAALALALLLPGGAAAQQQGGAKWYFGLGGGYHSSHMSFSDLNEDIFPESKNRGSGVFSVFALGEFGRNGNFAIRPQVSFLTRGGKLTDITIGEGRSEMLITDEQLAEYVNSIIDSQSTEVDVIAGATIDCQAIATALVQAFAQ